MNRLRAGAALCALAAAVSGHASAQAVETVGPAPAAQADSAVIPYPPAFFAEFRPSNASDAVQRLPGFTFDKGEDVRGFGGAAGNVLIDGERPTSKSVNLDMLLQRIPFSTIERIDLIRGGAPGIDMQGQPVVANVIRKSGASSVRNVQLLFKHYLDTDFVGYSPRIEQSTRAGPLSFEGGLGGRRDKNIDSGVGGLVRRRGDGTVFEQGDFTADIVTSSLSANVNGEYRTDASVYRLNAAVDRNDQDRKEVAALLDAAGSAFSERARTKTRADKAEIGGDYEREINGWLSARLLGLKTFKKDRLNGLSQTRGPSRDSLETSRSGETILRGTMSAVRSDRMQFEFGGEGAFNFLDAASSLFVGGAPVALPSANIRVEEKRAEGFATMTAKPFGALSVELGSRYETSTISQTGGANQKKTLSFLKPRLILSLAPDDSSQIRVRVERTVGQLNFKDFAATADVEAGAVNAGNPDLEPERAWVFETALERRFWGRAAVVLTLRHEAVQSVVDLIPIGGLFDAPGNIGDGTRDEARLSLTLPLDNLGVANGMFRINTTWRRSKVVDPVTGEERRISLQHPFDGDLYLGKSFPSLNSTLALEAGGNFGTLGYEEASYRINEIRTIKERPSWKVYWDWNPNPSLVVRFQWENFTQRKRLRERVLFAGPRSANLINYVERRDAALQSILMVRARQQF
jgi:hypothetical protein